MSPSPQIHELLRRLASLRDEEAHVLVALADAVERWREAPRVYTQRDGERPPGCGKRKYLGVHRMAVAAGDREAWREGRARIMTVACWARFAVTPNPRPQPSSATNDLTEELELWIKLGVAPPKPTPEERAAMIAMNFERRLAESLAADAARRAREDAANAKRKATKLARYGPSLRRK